MISLTGPIKILPVLARRPFSAFAKVNSRSTALQAIKSFPNQLPGLDRARGARSESSVQRFFGRGQREVDISVGMAEAQMIALQIHRQLEHAALHQLLAIAD